MGMRCLARYKDCCGEKNQCPISEPHLAKLVFFYLTETLKEGKMEILGILSLLHSIPHQ